jgi:hypothetical protein
LVARGDTVEEVRQLALDEGVSERTVWRWFAAMRAAGTIDLLDRIRLCWSCESCGEPLPSGATIRRRFCDGTCRQASNRHAAPRHRRRAPTGSTPPERRPAS